MHLTGEANEVYPELIQKVRTEGATLHPRGTTTLEIRPVMVTLKNPQRRLITSYGRPVNVAFALAEVLWILGGRADVEMISFYNSNVAQFSDDGELFNAAYGMRLRGAHGHDQLEDAVATLQADRDSRQAVMAIWHPKYDRNFFWAKHAPVITGPNVTKDRACNVLAHALVREDKLTWLQVVRSNDIIWGVPYNWMQWTHVQEYVADRLGLPMGDHTVVINSLHAYEPFWLGMENIWKFDLYEELGYDHAAMEADTTVVRVYEDSIRNDQPEQLKGFEHSLSGAVAPYWIGVLQVLFAHRLYTDHEDDRAIDVLANCVDPVYGAAAMRFCWHWRWSKNPELAHLAQEAATAAYPSKVVAWICS